MLRKDNGWSLVRSLDHSKEGHVPTAYLDTFIVPKGQSCSHKEMAVKAKAILYLEQTALENSTSVSTSIKRRIQRLNIKPGYSSAPSSPRIYRKEEYDEVFLSKSAVTSPQTEFLPVSKSSDWVEIDRPVERQQKSPRSPKVRQNKQMTVIEKGNDPGGAMVIRPLACRTRSISHDPQRAAVYLQNLHKSASCNSNRNRRSSETGANRLSIPLNLSPVMDRHCMSRSVCAEETREKTVPNEQRQKGRRGSSYTSAMSPMFDPLPLHITSNKHMQRRGTLDTLMAQKFGWRTDIRSGTERRNTMACITTKPAAFDVNNNRIQNKPLLPASSPSTKTERSTFVSMRPFLSICKEDSQDTPDHHITLV